MNLDSIDWGTLPYDLAQERQLELLQKRINGEIADTLIYTEHPPVYTLGRRQGADKHLLWSDKELSERGIALHQSSRGGDVTCHAPGQLILYPILDLSWRKDLHAYLRDLECILIDLIQSYGVEAHARPGLTGVWVENRKLAAIGVAVKQWVCYHGCSLNVNNELSLYDGIIPCGIQSSEGQVSSLKKELGHPLDLKELKLRWIELFRAHWRV